MRNHLVSGPEITSATPLQAGTTGTGGNTKAVTTRSRSDSAFERECDEVSCGGRNINGAVKTILQNFPPKKEA